MPITLLASLLLATAAGPPDLDASAILPPVGFRTLILRGGATDPGVDAGRIRVVGETEGAGLLRSLRIEHRAPATLVRLRVFRDGGAAPIVDATIDEIDTGRAEGLKESGGGLIVPRPPLVFRAGLRVELIGDPSGSCRIGLLMADSPRTLNVALAAERIPGVGGPPPARREEPAEYPIEAAARSTTVFLLPPGPRTVRLLEIEPASGTADAWREARIRLYWDGDDRDAPGVDLPIDLLFGRVASGGIVESLCVGEGAGGTSWQVRFPMPYRNQGLLKIDAPRALRGRIRLRTVGGRASDAGYFRASEGAVEDRDRGQLAGVVVIGGLPARAGHLVLDGRDQGPWPEALGMPTTADGGIGPGEMLGRIRGVEAANREIAGSYRWMAADPMTYHQLLRIEGSSSRGDGAERDAPRTAWFWYSERPGSGPSGPPRRGPRPRPAGDRPSVRSGRRRRGMRSGRAGFRIFARGKP